MDFKINRDTCFVAREIMYRGDSEKICSSYMRGLYNISTLTFDDVYIYTRIITNTWYE